MKIKNLTLLLLLGMISCSKQYEPVSTFTEAEDPVALTAEQTEQWAQLENGLHGAWGDIDIRYSRSALPQEVSDSMKIAAWRGERASAQLLLWSADSVDNLQCTVADFVSADGNRIDASIATPRFVRYTIADTLFRVHGPSVLSADMLDSLSRFDMAAATVRPVWLTINVPADATPGYYTSQITVSSNGNEDIVLPFELEVQKFALPAPKDWNYHLDLWQHPTAVARAYNLPVWSDEHFQALEPIMKTLADAGQKVVTATLNKDPWNHQCYDGYENMIQWTKLQDGTWSYDYTAFDRWVQLMLELGIDKMINCYSMVPWNCELEYFDEVSGEKVTVVAEPGTETFVQMWEPFLLDFKGHLQEKGWLGITNIAMDERSPEAMKAAAALLEKCATEMGFAIADNHQSYKQFTMMRDVCVAQNNSVVEHDDIVARRQNGQNTTFYVCCGPLYPNTFTYSEPFEAELLGWYKIAYDYDGMLRWAYNSWPENPQFDSRFGNWSSGDTYLVYPYNRPSVRFERLIDGIENAEKVQILRNLGVDMTEVDNQLQNIKNNNVNDSSLPWRQYTRQARQALEQASR